MKSRSLASLVACFGFACLLAALAQAQSLQLKPGDHVVVIGNTLAERLQHHGWFETLLHHRFPQHELVVRNLGFSGDELTVRLRSAGFGTPDDHLKFNQADVILAMFGYNESYGGEAGLEKFKADLDKFVKDTLKQQYNGRSAPRLVLVSPIAHENLHDRNLPDGTENNARLRVYTNAMYEVAKANQTLFVDLFTPSLELYAKAQRPLTINGVHLNDHGDREIAPVLDQALFGAAERPADPARLGKLREAVLDKNFHWFNRHRTVDGYSIYGGRADLKFVEGQTNRVVMAREMEVLDAMTANRDRRIWAVARGGDLVVDDSNTPPFVPVVTNKPGAGPNGAHLFNSGEASIAQMTPAKGMQVNLFASEEMFPELANPVQMAFDTRGRLWVAVMPSYPHWKPKEPMSDKVLILEDADGDGRADRCRVFADGLHVPTGLEFYNGGVLVGQQPDLMFLKDTDGDDVADVRERVLHGIDSADTHHALNSFVLDPGGALYFQEGTFHHTQVETPWTPSVRSANAGVFRYEPRTHKFDLYIAYGFANPHGHVFDRWGQDFVTDGTGNVNYFAAPFSGHIDFPSKHSGYKSFFQQRSRPCPGTEILSSRHFPPENQGNYLVGNVISFQGIFQYKMRDDGSGFGADEVEPIVSSTDPNFRPSDMEVGPDGALYFSDWQNPIIGHMQHNLRDPSRDRTHGRVYRVTCIDRPLLKPAKIAGEPVENLLELLKQPEDRVRYRAKIELGARDSDAVIAAVSRWLAALDPSDPDYEHHRMEALWVHQYHNVVNRELLVKMLRCGDFHARAAATRVLCYWRDRVDGALDLLREQAADEHPRVRLEAVRAASFFPVAEAVEVVAIAQDYPSDFFLDYCRNETLKVLDPLWKKALADGRKVAVKTDAGARFFLRNMPLEQLLVLPRDKPVYLELLYRGGVRDEVRRETLRELARLDQRSELQVLVAAIRAIDRKEENRGESIVFDMIRLLGGRSPSELAVVRGDLEQLASSAQQPEIRQAGYIALMTVDGSVEQAWSLGSRSVASLRDLLAAVPYVADASLRAAIYPKVEPLLKGLPVELASSKTSSGATGRYVRIELAGKGTLTLAEVEVLSDGRNVARGGKATQKNTAHGGDARRGIDGNKKPEFGGGGQTHTQENTDKPWWEVDLGQEVPIESIAVFNRGDGGLGKRLDGFSLIVLDAARQVVFRRDKLPAPKDKAQFDLEGSSPEAIVRRAAMNALASVRGQEARTFELLAPLARGGADRAAAIRALQRVPRQFWPKETADSLLAATLDYVRKVPPADRTAEPVLDALEFADALAALVPAEQAKAARAELAELGVKVVRVGTLLERMSYDKDVIVVRAGKPVEFILENTDMMPHNFVIVAPGSLEEVGLLAESQAQQPAFQQRQFVPQSSKVLLASALLQPRDSQKLSFVAPTQPGVYPYVCTYPGHWRRMYGALYVVADLDAYQTNPEAYLTANPLPIKDDLLKDRRPRTEWKLDDLAAAVTALEGRAYGTGKQMFTVASCVACHKLDGVGNLFGPDLAKLDPKLQPLDLLKEMLDPSAKINEKFQSYLFELDSGKIITGLIVEETPAALKVIENPLAKAQPIELKKSEIVSRQKSPISMMPKGLLDKLARDEILDLIAYLAARGDKNHPLFKPTAAHGGEH